MRSGPRLWLVWLTTACGRDFTTSSAKTPPASNEGWPQVKLQGIVFNLTNVFRKYLQPICASGTPKIRADRCRLPSRISNGGFVMVLARPRSRADLVNIMSDKSATARFWREEMPRKGTAVGPPVGTAVRDDSRDVTCRTKPRYEALIRHVRDEESRHKEACYMELSSNSCLPYTTSTLPRREAQRGHEFQ